MIILTLLLLEGMAFMLGHILGRQSAEKREPSKENRCDTALTVNREVKNFLDYDGSEQV